MLLVEDNDLNQELALELPRHAGIAVTRVPVGGEEPEAACRGLIRRTGGVEAASVVADADADAERNPALVIAKSDPDALVGMGDEISDDL